MSLPASIYHKTRANCVAGEVVYDEKTIRTRVAQLGLKISTDYAGKELLVVGILKGALVFTCDLVRELQIPLHLDFIAISRYAVQRRTGKVRIVKDLQEDIAGRHVLLVEDIVDTGLTANYLCGLLSARRPASLRLCTLLDRPELRLAELPLNYVGFQVSREFLIGYGLDYQDRYRDLPFIASMNLTSARVE